MCCPSRLTREKPLWMSLVYICVFHCHDMRAEMDQIASQHEPTVVFLWLLHVSLLACLARALCVVSENLAGCQQVRVACLLLISSSARALRPLAVWSRPGAPTHLISPDRVLGAESRVSLHLSQSFALPTAICSFFFNLHPRHS